MKLIDVGEGHPLAATAVQQAENLIAAISATHAMRSDPAAIPTAAIQVEDSLFAVCAVPMTRDEALTFAASVGANLATFDRSTKQEALGQLAYAPSHVGLSADAGGTIVWGHGEPVASDVKTRGQSVATDIFIRVIGGRQLAGLAVR